MGSKTIIKSLLACGLIFSVGQASGTEDFSSGFDSFKQEQTNFFSDFKQTSQDEFESYKKAFDEAYKEYTKEIKEKWPEPEISNKFKWVEYTPQFNSKKVIDYEKEEIKLESFAKDEEEAIKGFKKSFEDLFNKSVKNAYDEDFIEKKVAKKLNTPKLEIKSNEKLISDVVKEDEKKVMVESIKKENLVVVKHKDKFIYKLNIKLPSTAMIRKAKALKEDVVKNANKHNIPAELVYAIIHSESSFNPMARSYVPAYGLMQIVPKTAGIDSYNFLYGYKRLLSASYLYNGTKNIQIGTAYIHILYYRYLKSIKDPQSRLYCAIAAYNTGAGNVARAFSGTNNVKKASYKINSMSSDEVYNYLINNLPYSETKRYLKKVNDRVSAYNKLLNTSL